MAAGFAPRYTGLKISDMFLEIGSNVGSAARRGELGVAEIPIGRWALRPQTTKYEPASLSSSTAALGLTRDAFTSREVAHMAAKIEIVHWDWAEEPDTEWINEGLQAVFDGKHCPFIRNVPDAGGEFGVAVASKLITADEAQQAWDRFMAELAGERKNA